MANDALTLLQHCRSCTSAARGFADIARKDLVGARLTRCEELMQLLADAEQHATRLAVVVTGDQRAGLQEVAALPEVIDDELFDRFVKALDDIAARDG